MELGIPELPERRREFESDGQEIHDCDRSIDWLLAGGGPGIRPDAKRNNFIIDASAQRVRFVRARNASHSCPGCSGSLDTS